MLRIELLGTSFNVESDRSEEYLDRVIAHFTSRVAEIENSVRNRDPLKKAILAGLLVTDDYLQQQSSGIDADQARAVDEIATRLIRQIDENMGAEDE